MSSDYIKQLEDSNWNLKNRLEQSESRCEWLEKLHMLKITSGWSIENTYTVGVNNYRSTELRVGCAYPIAKDELIGEIMESIYGDVIQPNIVWRTDTNKVTVKNDYTGWRESMMSFVAIGGRVFNEQKYISIQKMYMKTNLYLGFGRVVDDTNIIENEKNFIQGITINICRGEKFPSCKVSVAKTVDGLVCNNKFMSFGKDIKVLNNIYETMDKLAEGVAQMNAEDAKNAKK